MSSKVLTRWVNFLLTVMLGMSLFSWLNLAYGPKAVAGEITNWVDGKGKTVTKAELENVDWTKRLKFLSPINIYDTTTQTTYTYKGDSLFGNGSTGFIADEGQRLFFPEGKSTNFVLDDKSNCYGVIVWYITDSATKSNLELAQPRLSSSGVACSINSKAIPENTDVDPEDSLRIIDDNSNGGWSKYYGIADWLVSAFYWTSPDALGIYDTQKTAAKLSDVVYDNIKDSLQKNSLYNQMLSNSTKSTLDFWQPGDCKNEVLVTEKIDGKVQPYGYYVQFNTDPRDGIPTTVKFIDIGYGDYRCLLGRELQDNNFDVINYQNSPEGKKNKLPIALAPQVNDPAANPTVAPPFSANSGGVLAGNSCYSNIANVFGFILCPVFDAIDKFVIWGESALTGQLTVDLGNADTRRGLESAWQQMARIASSLLVIIGLIMVTSTALGLKFFDAYTVKKILPRIVIGAVGIWFSWALVTTYIDFMNALGQALGGIMLSQFNGGESFSLTEIWAKATEGAGNGSTVVGTTLFAGLAAWSAISAGPFIILGLGLTTLIGFATAIAVLTIRQAIIIFLAILAPIAIAAWILPNTKGVWSKWFKLLNSLLLMYPLIIGTLAAGKIFSLIAASRLDGDSGNIDKMLGIVVAVISYVGPLFLIPGLIKSSNAIMGKLSGGIGKVAGNATGGLNSSLQNAAKNRKAVKGLLADANASANKNLNVRGPGISFRQGAINAQKRMRARGRIGMKNFGQGAIAGGEASDLIRAETAANFEKRATEVGSIQLRNSGVGAVGTQYTYRDVDTGAIVTSPKVGDALKSYAAGNAITTTDSGGNSTTFDHSNTSPIARSALFGKMAADGNIEALRQAITAGGDQARAANEAISNNTAAVMAKAPDLIKTAAGAFGDFKAGDVAGWDASTLNAAMDSISAMGPGAARDKAVATLNSSLELIATTPALKQNFSAKQVLAIKNHTGAGSVLSGAVASRLMPDGTLN